MSAYRPKTGAKCECRQGVERDNCPRCEGTGMVIDFKAIREKPQQPAEGAQFTPGPWTIQRSTDTQTYIRGDDGESVANLYRLQPRVEANASLIAAAPAMYEALQATYNVMVNILTDSQLDTRTACGLTIREWTKATREALAQAEGRQG